jgi:short-subunit dehydrogenase
MTTRTAAIVTGASSGLGAEYAKLFAADGHDLVLVARRRDRLEALARELEAAHGIRAHVLAADLAAPPGAGRVVDEVNRLGVEVEFLVNNAGFGASGALTESDLARLLEMVQLNVTALVMLTRAFLPGMIARRRGRILNVGSTAGFVPGPFMAVYYASKAFVNSFTEALWYELRGTGVTATVSCPGATATEFAAVAGNERSLLFRMGAAPAATVARQAYRAMRRGRPLVVHGLKNQLTIQSLRFSPRGVVRAIAASLNPPPAVSPSS